MPKFIIPGNDRIRLRHMLESASEAQEFAGSKSRSDLNSDRMLVLALMKAVEIIGEAATKISNETKSRLAHIPWPQIEGMRHRLVHAYFRVDLDLLWDTVQVDLPPLLDALRRIFEGERGSQDEREFP